MKLVFDGILSSDGGFADIWRAHDETDRLVAVKIIRDSSIGISDALAHAKALVRATHKNIVIVYAVTDVIDPGGSGKQVPAIVMEYLEGETLHDAMSRRLFSSMEVLQISIGLINAVQHIHREGLVHGDLHEKNIMLVSGETKIIDLLHRYSLLTVDAGKREILRNREVDAVRVLITQIATKSSIDPPRTHVFLQDVRTANNLDAMAVAVWTLCGATSGATSPTPNSPSISLEKSKSLAQEFQLQNDSADSSARLGEAGEVLSHNTKQVANLLHARVIPRKTQLTIVNAGLAENASTHVSTLTLTTDEPAILSKSIEEIRRRLKNYISLDKSSTTSDGPLSAFLENVNTRPRLLEWLATTPFSAHLYFSSRTELEDKAIWPQSRLNTEFVILPIVHRLSHKAILVERMTSDIGQMDVHLDAAIALIKTKFHRPVLRPAANSRNRNPNKSLLELAELVLNCCQSYLANPSDDAVRADFAYVRTRLKYAANVVTGEKHTRDKNPLP